MATIARLMPKEKMHSYDKFLLKRYEKLINKVFDLLQESKHVSYWDQFRLESEGFYEVKLINDKEICRLDTFPEIIPEGLYEKARIWMLKKQIAGLPYDEGILAQFRPRLGIRMHMITKPPVKKTIFTLQK